MKNIFFLITIMIFLPQSLSARVDTVYHKKFSKVKISLNNNRERIKGYLYEINDSSISVIYHRPFGNPDRVNYSPFFSNPDKIHYSNIKIVKIRRYYNPLIVGLSGIVAGFAIGGLIGYNQVDDSPPSPHTITWDGFSKKESALVSGVCGAAIGAVAGTTVGSISIPIRINGKIENFNHNRNRLKKYSYKR